jgi:hypothetical protein
MNDFDLNLYPEMLRMREEGIHCRQQTEQKYLNKLFKNKEVSPRTYERKRQELEVWVSTEQEEVKKTKKKFEEEWKKTKDIIEMTQKNSENL